ncbi:unnamed protein product, partial [Ectocarpus sp. 12 AP-2014]
GAIIPASPDALAPFDEFHIGGRKATAPLIDGLKLSQGQRVLDMGCGLGGSARYAARSGASVVGVDVTAEFVAVGRDLTEISGLSDRVKHVRASLLDMPFENDLFDACFMIHVGMNIADKHGIAAEAARVLKPGGRFAIYDIMRLREGDLTYPVPWATSPRQSSVVHPERYRFALENAGFEILSETNRADFALDFYKKMAADPGAPMHLGQTLLMGDKAEAKL